MSHIKSLDGFRMHLGETPHTSVSQINRQEQSLSAWYAEKVLGVRFPTGPAMWRGIVVEDACAGILAHGQAEEDATKAALERFDEKVTFDEDGKAAKERVGIPGMIELAIKELAPLGQPDFPELGGQHKVEIKVKGDGWVLPLIGYLDFVYPKHKLVVDLKTTLRMPTKMSRSHQRQRALYGRCMKGYAVKFLYTTPKKASWLEDGDMDECLAEMKAILNRTERFLRLGDQETLAAAMPVRLDDWAWSGMEHVRKECFGI